MRTCIKWVISGEPIPWMLKSSIKLTCATISWW
jgi:hypothetical protein